MDRRIDRRTQLYIEAVLNSLPSIGQGRAALALRELGVPIETALRVLTQPHGRRQAGGPTAVIPPAPATP
jgi:hypothetical protein